MKNTAQAELHRPGLEDASSTDPPARLVSPSELERGIPLASWSEERLAARAVLENSRIGDDEGRVTPHYWFLGSVLNLLRRGYAKGEWETWLARHNIGETRALRSRQVARAFRSPDDLHGLSLRQALKLARHKSGKKVGGLDPKFARRLRAMVKTLRATVTDLKLVDPAVADQRSRLLGPAHEASRLLATLCHVCAEQSEQMPTAPAGRSRPKRKPR